MPDEFGEAKSQFVEAMAEKSEYQRWSTCVEQLMPFMDMTMARMFVDAHFDENTKSTVKSSYSLLLHWAFLKKLRVWLLLSDVICDFHVSHNAIWFSPQILHNYHFQFLLGLIIVLWEIENNTFAKCLGDKHIRIGNVKVAYGEFKQQPKGSHHLKW